MYLVFTSESELTEKYVNKMLLDGSNEGFEAKGVEIRSKNGSVHEIYADEIIVAAGALQSPQILENFSIGSKEILEGCGIDVLIDDPGVGENLQDHTFSSVSFEVADGQISGDIVRDPKVVEMLVKQYEESQSGPLSGLPFSLAYVPPVDIEGRMGAEDIASLTEAHIDTNSSSLRPGSKAQYAELQKLIQDPNESTCFYGLGPAQMHILPE